MKDKIVYIASFVLTFVLVSAALIYVNTLFKNIFIFDLTPVSANYSETMEDSTAIAEEPVKTEENIAAVDSIKTDSTKINTDTLAVKKDSLKAGMANKTDAPKKTEDKKAESKTHVAQLTAEPPAKQVSPVISKTKRDSVYKSWVKETSKLYETMDTRKAAKVIQGYSDNIARDILLSMKKKKAAEILSELKPEVVTRIISVN